MWVWSMVPIVSLHNPLQCSLKNEVMSVDHESVTQKLLYIHIEMIVVVTKPVLRLPKK